MRRDDDSQLLFILGTGRCGTTMVQEVMVRHPDVGFISNVDERIRKVPSKDRLNNWIYRRAAPHLSQRGRMVGRVLPRRLHFDPTEAYSLISREVSPVMWRPYRDLTASDVSPWLAKRLRSFFDARMNSQGKPVFIHKFTGWPRAGLLQAVFPRAKFLHVVRDGRAVASSLMQRPWWLGSRGVPEWSFGYLPEAYRREWEAAGESFVALAALEWKLLIDAFESARNEVPRDQWMTVRYEDFVKQPRASLDNMLRFAGLSWCPGFEAALAKYPISDSRTAPYSEDLSPEQVNLMEQILEAPLRELGYIDDVAVGRDQVAQAAGG